MEQMDGGGLENERSVRSDNLKVVQLAPVADWLGCWSVKSRTGPEQMTYQTAQVLAPAALMVVLVEVVQEHDEDDQDKDEGGGSDQPPCPPQGLSILEEAERLLDESSRSWLIGIGTVRAWTRRRSVIEALTQGIGRVQQTDAQAQAHEESANVGEVVQAWQEAQDETHDHIDGDVGEIDKRPLALPPAVE